MGERSFSYTEARRERVPLLVALVGPSGSGKTFSALELATGIQQVDGGDIAFIDTEARRSLHYADRFKFKFLPLEAPFGSLDYLAAIEYAIAHGAKTVIVDSMSHEHEGPGGMLEQHEAEMHRMAGDDWQKRERVKFLAWQKPKAARRRLLNSMIQKNCNFILNFRAKEKIEIKRGSKDPLNLGWQPIGGEEFVFEMTLGCLLLPGCKGVPTWHSEEAGERAVIKLPTQFTEVFKDSPVLSRGIGRKLAEWAKGGDVSAPAAAPAPASTAAPVVADPAPAPTGVPVALFLELRQGLHNATTEESLKAAWGRVWKLHMDHRLSVDQFTALETDKGDKKLELSKGGQQ